MFRCVQSLITKSYKTSIRQQPMLCKKGSEDSSVNPRVWLREGETSIKERLIKAFEDLNISKVRGAHQ